MAAGGFKTGGTGLVEGDGVLIYNRDAPLAPGNKGDCDIIDLTGGSDLDLAPMGEGDYEHLTFWQDEDCTERFKYTGGHTAFSGVIYAPGAVMDIAGGGDLGPIQVIADTFDISGNASMSINFTGYVGGESQGQLSLIE